MRRCPECEEEIRELHRDYIGSVIIKAINSKGRIKPINQLKEDYYPLRSWYCPECQCPITDDNEEARSFLRRDELEIKVDKALEK